jgi:hypothetical protein
MLQSLTALDRSIEALMCRAGSYPPTTPQERVAEKPIFFSFSITMTVREIAGETVTLFEKKRAEMATIPQKAWFRRHLVHVLATVARA